MIPYLDLPHSVFFLAAALVLSGVLAVLHRRKMVACAIGVALLLLVALLSSAMLYTGTDATAFGLFHLDPFSLLFCLLFSVVVLFVYLLSYRHSKDFNTLSMLLGFSYLGMLAVAASESMITTIIGLEIVSVASAFMIISEGRHRVEAAVKFFILSGIAIAFLTFALAVVFPYDSSLSLSGIAVAGNGYLLVLGMLLFAIGFSFEAAIFPFSLWVPDVYQGAATNVTALIAGTNKTVAFVAIMLVFFTVFAALSPQFSALFTILSILTMFFGNIVALVQKNVKRMLAYSAISQAGYIMVGLAVATASGVEASVFQLFAHAFMAVGAFAIVLWLESRELNSVEDYTGLHYRNSFCAASLTILMLSMVGVPPLMGFVGKLLLFSSAISANMLLLAFVGIFNTFISIYYYGKVISSMYTKRDRKRMIMDRYTAFVVLACVAVIIVFGVYPTPLIDAARGAAAMLV